MDADQIVKIAKDANDTSTKAYNLLMKTLDGEGKTSQEIDELNKKYNEAKELAKNLEKQANKVQAEAEDAGNKALKIFANLTSLPPFDTKALEDEAGKIKKEASDLDKLIDKTEKEYNDLRDDLKAKELEVRKLLEKGKSEQQASDNAKEAEDNARKAKSAVKAVLSTITSLLDQLGNIDKVDLSRLNQIDESLKRAKGKMANSDLDKKLAELNEVARTQGEMIDDYDRQIREIRADISNLNDIKNTLPEGCFNTASMERP
eukprot:superscaffoldBa00006628_g21734